MDSDFVVGINKSIDAAKGETGQTYPAYLHNTLVTEKLDELAGAISEGGGGASALSDLTDVDISGTVQGGKVLKYNAVEEKWAPGDDSGNVQSDWNESDPTSGAYILNKPTIPSAIAGCTMTVYHIMDSYETTISIIYNSSTVYTKNVNAGNHWGEFDTITETFTVGGAVNTITMYGDGRNTDEAQNWLHITLNDLHYDLGNTVRNPSFPLDLSFDSAIKVGGKIQADWNETNQNSDAFIKNKPTIPSTITGLNDIPDVDLTNPTDGQTIKYDATLGKWVNADGGGGSSITVIPGTLNAGDTTVTISNAAITANSIIIPCVDEAFTGVAPTAQATAAGSVTLTFPVQSTNMPVKVVVI